MDAALVWFRRDLRPHDHAALYHALRAARRVYCAFVFDRAILDPLLAQGLVRDRRVEFILHAVRELAQALNDRGGALIVRHGFAAEEIVRLADELRVDAVFANHDYEPEAIARDQQVDAALAAAGRRLLTFKDQVIFDRDELVTGAGNPFSVFTPYRNAWLRKLTPFHVKSYPVERHAAALARPERSEPIPSLAKLGFSITNVGSLRLATGAVGAARVFDEFKERIGDYDRLRDFPARNGPSYLSVHLRFGTVSIRALAAFAVERAAAGSRGAEVWLSELIWRDFFQQVLFHHPHVAARAFRPEYDRIRWNDDPERFAAWCEGRTGYPLVDAAMAQLNGTGFMHNRLRMVVASFLIKDLGIDWRRGERYFAHCLNDFDLAANNGNWQWAASSGCDAQPYFRIFNPVAQSERFDPDGAFIRRYLPQLAGFTDREIHAPWCVPIARQRTAGCVIGIDYPAPLVDHATARRQTLDRYAVVRRG
jgi:deoxyribodipyrimidine photo-lyase